MFYPQGKGAVKVAIMGQSTIYFKEALKSETNPENKQACNTENSQNGIPNLDLMHVGNEFTNIVNKSFCIKFLQTKQWLQLRCNDDDGISRCKSRCNWCRDEVYYKSCVKRKKYCCNRFLALSIYTVHSYVCVWLNQLTSKYIINAINYEVSHVACRRQQVTFKNYLRKHH